MKAKKFSLTLPKKKQILLKMLMNLTIIRSNKVSKKVLKPYKLDSHLNRFKHFIQLLIKI
jgi:hypothetical protein